MLNVGKKLIKEYCVDSFMSASQVGSGSLEVLSTPYLLAFMENCCMNLVIDELEEGNTTVGIKADLSHLAPSKINSLISVEATLVNIEKRILTFEVEAFDQDVLVSKMMHQRCIVNIDRFMSKLK